ncbi:hypothetical protein CR513_25253, partial [Mucuna pruriens]
MKVDQVLSCFDYLDYEKVRMVTYEFTGYALFCRETHEGRRRHVDTWVDLKKDMRTRFILASYARDLYNKLQQIHLASRKTYPNTSSNLRGKERRKKGLKGTKVPRMGVYYPQAERKKGSYQIHHLHPKITSSSVSNA